MTDPQKSIQDWHGKLVELAERFTSIAKEKLPICESTKGAWTEVKQTLQGILREKAIWDHRVKYERAATEAGMVLISLSNSGIITDQQLKALVAAHELGAFNGLIGTPANLFALYVGGPRIELCHNGRITQFQTCGDGVPPELILLPSPNVSIVSEATRQALGTPPDPPPPDPAQCLRYADFCLSLAKEVPAVPSAPEAPLPDEQQNHGKLAPSAEKAYRLYEWAIIQDPGPSDHTDRTVYDWLKNDPRIEEPLTWTFDSFQTLLSRARKHYGTSKHKSRQGRTGRSTRKSEQI